MPFICFVFPLIQHINTVLLLCPPKEKVKCLCKKNKVKVKTEIKKRKKKKEERAGQSYDKKKKSVDPIGK